MAGRPRRVSPVSVTDHLLVDILDELRAVRAQLIQEPSEPGPEPEPVLRLVTEPAPLAAPEPPPDPDMPEPPRHGKSSGRSAWVAYADRLGVQYPPDARQREIVAAVDAAKRDVA